MKFSSTSRAAFLVAAAGLGLGLAIVPATAQQRQDEAARPAEPAKEPEKPITQQDVDAKDVALTPLSDLNIKKGEIPQLLIDAEDNPYTLRGLARCSDLAAAIGRFDAVLGDDIDVAEAANKRLSAGRAAQEALGSFIPFRGLIREVSGANSQQRKIQNAIYAGTARRSFLKGIGQERGCLYPARSAGPEDIARAEARAEAAEAAARARKAAKSQPARSSGSQPQKPR